MWIHRKNPPGLALKTIIPETGKEKIYRDLQERDPNSPACAPKTKERYDLRRANRARGGGYVIAVTRENHETSGPALITIDIRSRRWLHWSKALKTRNGGSPIARPGITEECSDDQRGLLGSKVPASLAVAVMVQVDWTGRWEKDGLRIG